MSALLLTTKDLTGLISMREASEAMKIAFGELALGKATAPVRTHVDVASVGGKTLLMGAHVPGMGLAAKIVSFFPQNVAENKPAIHGLIAVMDPQSGELEALCDGTYLTAFRTGAGSCAATDLLAGAQARVGALIGAGGQAPAQLLAMVTARPLTEVRLFARRREAAEALAQRMGDQTSARLVVVDSADVAVAGADIITASTSSSTPVFDGTKLKRGAHVNAIGSITPLMEEVDQAVVSRARIFVDHVQGALEEAGELILGLSRGLTKVEDWTELGLVAAGKHSGRQSLQELTFYKSVGHAVQDVAIARLAVNRAKKKGLGTPIDF